VVLVLKCLEVKRIGINGHLDVRHVEFDISSDEECVAHSLDHSS